MPDATERPLPRARPVTGGGLEALAARAELLARRWAAALVLTRPVGSLGRISLEEVGTGAAELCRQVIAALGDDHELDRLLDVAPPDGGLPLLERPAALSGATGASAVVESVEALRGVVWEALLAQPIGEDEDAARAGDRLAHVCAALSARAVERGRAAGGRPWRFPERPPPPRGPSETETRVVIVDERGDADPPPDEGAAAPRQPEGAAPGAVHERGARRGSGPAAQAFAVREERRGSAPPPGAVAVRDERRGSAPPRGAFAVREERRGSAPPPGRAGEREIAVPQERRESAPPPARAGEREIAIRDARCDEGAAAWIRSIGAQLERFHSDDSPFAVLLLSLVPSQVEGSLPPEEELEVALAEELDAAGGGSLTRERVGRWWVVAGRVDAIGAHDLALRLERAAAALAARSNTPVRVAAGVALCPEDGADAAALAAHADVGLYESRRGREPL